MFSNFLPGQNSDYLWKFYHIHIYFFYQKSGPVCFSYCIKKIYASFTELSTLNLVECKIYKQYKVSLLFYFLFFLLYILSESKKRIHGFWCTFKSNNSYSIVTAWNRIECMSNTPWLENENNFSLSYSNKRNATKSSRTTYFITEATAYTKTRSAAQWRKLAYYGPGYGRQLTKSALTICTSSTTETRVW